MNNKLLVIFAGFFLVIALSGLITWAYYKPPKSDHRAVVADSSLSAASDPCLETSKVAEIALVRPPVNDKTKLFVFLTGDQSTANEPRSLGAFDIPIRIKLTESNTQLSSQRDGIVNDIKQRCQEEGVSTSSSIFLAVKRAVEALRSADCDNKSKCAVLVQTDLQENADIQIKTAISNDAVNLKSLPAPIDNLGVAIRFCGVSETKGEVEALDKNGRKGKKTRLTQNRNSNRVDHIQAIWKKLFLYPELVSFSPSCIE